MFMYQVAMHREKIENKIWALTAGVFLIPFLLLFSCENDLKTLIILIRNKKKIFFLFIIFYIIKLFNFKSM